MQDRHNVYLTKIMTDHKGSSNRPDNMQNENLKVSLNKSQGTRHRDLYISSCQITRSNSLDWVTQARTFSRRLPELSSLA